MFKILVAVKGSDRCSKVAQKAQEMALLCKGSVTFVTVVTPEHRLIRSKEEFEQANLDLEMKKKESEEALEVCSTLYGQCEVELGKKGLETKRIVLEGNHPAEKICNYAEDEEFDLIVIADKADKSIKEKLLGSTAEKIIKHAKTSVLVVK